MKTQFKTKQREQQPRNYKEMKTKYNFKTL